MSAIKVRMGNTHEHKYQTKHSRSPQRIAMGRPKWWHASMNGSTSFRKGSDGRSPKERLSSAGNTAVAHSPVSPRNAGKTSGASLSDICSLRTATNGRRSSNHCALFMSSCHLGCRQSFPLTSSCSTLERRADDWLHICVNEETCRFDPPHSTRSEKCLGPTVPSRGPRTILAQL